MTYYLSRRWDSNPRPTVYETVALPLSYFGAFLAKRCWAATAAPIVVGAGATPARYLNLSEKQRRNKSKSSEYKAD